MHDLIMLLFTKSETKMLTNTKIYINHNHTN